MRKLTTLALVLFLTSQQLWAQDTGRYVAKVRDISGDRLVTNRRTEGRWFQAYPGMKSFLKERLRTDQKTLAVLEFVLGGQAGISPNTEVEIVANDEIRNVSDTVLVKAGVIWAKMDKQEEVLQIETASGVIGIEGTELLVAYDEEKEVTEVLLFEGQVTVTDNEGSTKTLKPGDYASMGGGSGGMCVLSYPPTSLRTLVVERFPKFASFLSAHKVTSIPKPASPTLIRGFLKPEPSLGSLLEASDQNLNGPQAVSGITPSQTRTEGRPTFSWAAFPGASEYQVVLANDEGMEEIAFSGRSEGPSFEIPAGAPGLESGRYYLRIIPLDGEGKALEGSAQTWFETSGWESQGIALQGEQ